MRISASGTTSSSTPLKTIKQSGDGTHAFSSRIEGNDPATCPSSRNEGSDRGTGTSGKPCRISFRLLKGQAGFSLIELIVAITLIAVMSVVVAPRITGYLGGQRKNLTILTTVMTKVFDDSFINNRTNFLALHTAYPDIEQSDTADEGNREILGRVNGYSVVSLTAEGKMEESDRPLLKSRAFPGSFTINSVLLSNGTVKSAGTVLIPFYPEGYSADTIVHVSTAQGKDYSIILSKLKKEPYVREGLVDFETMWQGDAF